MKIVYLLHEFLKISVMKHKIRTRLLNPQVKNYTITKSGENLYDYKSFPLNLPKKKKKIFMGTKFVYRFAFYICNFYYDT
jgi:regulator of replication initiation timing